MLLIACLDGMSLIILLPYVAEGMAINVFSGSSLNTSPLNPILFTESTRMMSQNAQTRLSEITTFYCSFPLYFNCVKPFWLISSLCIQNPTFVSIALNNLNYAEFCSRWLPFCLFLYFSIFFYSIPIFALTLPLKLPICLAQSLTT